MSQNGTMKKAMKLGLCGRLATAIFVAVGWGLGLCPSAEGKLALTKKSFLAPKNQDELLALGGSVLGCLGASCCYQMTNKHCDDCLKIPLLEAGDATINSYVGLCAAAANCGSTVLESPLYACATACCCFGAHQVYTHVLAPGTGGVYCYKKDEDGNVQRYAYAGGQGENDPQMLWAEKRNEKGEVVEKIHVTAKGGQAALKKDLEKVANERNRSMLTGGASNKALKDDAEADQRTWERTNKITHPDGRVEEERSTLFNRK
ncbi:unnamed protein product [Amoebophrya sp. A120]|nr:unnamed protein product [Amoebophrya sp. A120]|eukprot:GSA120T00006478001.1